MIHRLLAVALIAGTPAMFLSSAQAGQFDAKPMNSGAPDMMMQPAAQPAPAGDATGAPPVKKHMSKKMMMKKTMAKKDGM